MIKAANLAKFNLKIVGSGRDFERLKQTAGPTVEFLGNLSDQELKKTYLNAKAFLFASKDEEFGIAPVETMGYGLPIIAFRSGGLPEYLIDDKNGCLFDHLDENSLVEKVKKFESLKVEKLKKMRKEARKTAERFSEKIFKENILNFVNSKTNAGTS